MRTLFIFIIFLLGETACTLSPQAASYLKIAESKSLTFTGEVSRDQLFEQEISETLVFRLIPQTFDGEGWLIWIIESQKDMLCLNASNLRLNFLDLIPSEQGSYKACQK
jgi:hypothetical protein